MSRNTSRWDYVSIPTTPLILIYPCTDWLTIPLVNCHRISSPNSCKQPKKRTSHRMDPRNLTMVGQSTDHGRNSFNVCGIGCMDMPHPQQCLRMALPSLTRELSVPQVLAFVSRLTKWFFFPVVVHPPIPQSYVPIQLSMPPPLPLLWMNHALEALLIMTDTTMALLFVTYHWSSTISRNVTAVHSPLYLLQGRSQKALREILLKITNTCVQNFTTTKTSGNGRRHLSSTTFSPNFHLFFLFGHY